MRKGTRSKRHTKTATKTKKLSRFATCFIVVVPLFDPQGSHIIAKGIRQLILVRAHEIMKHSIVSGTDLVIVQHGATAINFIEEIARHIATTNI